MQARGSFSRCPKIRAFAERDSEALEGSQSSGLGLARVFGIRATTAQPCQMLASS